MKQPKRESYIRCRRACAFFGISNIASTIQKLEKGMILDPEELVSVSDFLRGCRKIKNLC